MDFTILGINTYSNPLLLKASCPIFSTLTPLITWGIITFLVHVSLSLYPVMVLVVVLNSKHDEGVVLHSPLYTLNESSYPNAQKFPS